MADITASDITASLAREFHAEGFVVLAPRHLRPPDALVERVRDAALRKFDAHLRLASRRALDLRQLKNAESLDGFYVRQGGRVDMRIAAQSFQSPRPVRAGSVDNAKRAEDEKEEEEAELEVDAAPFHEMAQCWQELVDEIFRAESADSASGAATTATAPVTHRLEYIGCVVARPGDADQNWHLDGVHRNLLAHEKADRLNVFVPLVDLADKRVGGTEMKRRSHFRAPSAGGAAAFGSYAHLESVTHRVAAGTPIVMDYRVWHRGLANASDAVVRPLLYFKYAAQAPSSVTPGTGKRPVATDAELKQQQKSKKRVVLTHVAK
ncbi:hypothetical protein PybrP1_008289 [[Pythium] brassicae (nom. inval.)]|nr:hypothetical protein PybrP1_008289 [[Pythium] brassicae (nom. inval.)]